MEIRELTENELGKLLSLYSHLHSEDSPPPEQGEIDDIWQGIVNNDSFKCLGLFIGEELVSSCCLVVIPNLTRSCRPYGVIENVVTHENHRRHSYGKKILKSALQIAWNENCYKVMLMTGRKDQGIYDFYQSAGFDGNAKQAFVAKHLD